MSNRAYAENLIAELGRALDLDRLELDEQDRCGILFEDRITVEIEFNSRNNTLILVSDLGPVDSDDPVNIYRLVLNANLNGEEAAPVLALDEESGSMVQFTTLYLFSIDSFSRFETILESFVNSALHWQGVVSGKPGIQSGNDTPAESAGGQEESGGPFSFKPDNLA